MIKCPSTLERLKIVTVGKEGGRKRFSSSRSHGDNQLVCVLEVPRQVQGSIFEKVIIFKNA